MNVFLSLSDNPDQLLWASASNLDCSAESGSSHFVFDWSSLLRIDTIVGGTGTDGDGLVGAGVAGLGGGVGGGGTVVGGGVVGAGFDGVAGGGFVVVGGGALRGDRGGGVAQLRKKHIANNEIRARFIRFLFLIFPSSLLTITMANPFSKSHIFSLPSFQGGGSRGRSYII